MTEQTAKVFVTQSTTGRRVELDLRVPASTSQPPAAVELLEKVKLAFGPGTLENVERTQIVASGTTITNRAEFVWYPAQESSASGGEASLKARLAQLENELLMSMCTVTDDAAVGKTILAFADKADVAAMASLLKQDLHRLPDHMEAVVQGLDATTVGDLYNRAAAATLEAPVQEFFAVLTDEICKRNTHQQQQPIYSCDTSSSGYPTMPSIHRIDLIFSSRPKPPTGQVLFSTVISLGEVKTDLSAVHDYHIAIGQVASRVHALYQTQPRRVWCYAFVAGKAGVEVFLFRREEGDKTFSSVRRTGQLPLFLACHSPGLQWLVRLLHSSPTLLGFDPPQPPGRFATVVDGISNEVQFHDLLQADVHKTGSVVYSCSVEGVGSGVYKAGPTAHVEADILLELADSGITGIPHVWAKGHLDGTPYLIEYPKGIPVDYNCTDKELWTVTYQTANTLSILFAAAQRLHLDVAPGNIIRGETTLLIDFHTSMKVDQVSHWISKAGRLPFLSISRLDGDNPPNLSGELESLLYCLVYWACDGQLHWSHAKSASFASALKFEAMHRLFQAKVLFRCKRGDAIKALIKGLRDLFFNPGYKTDVTPQQFLKVCEENIPAA